jgi:threonine/homoserine/homoserine lactone efflux protein
MLRRHARRPVPRLVTLDLFLRGLAIGFAIAVALGPIGLLVIRRTVERGWAHGFLSGMGVATADALYGAVAAFGLTAITEILVGIDRPLGIVGGAVLVALAIRSLRSAPRITGEATVPRAQAEGRRLDGRFAAFGSMVALTATNPATILSFAALFASIGAGTGGPAGATAVVIGVFTGSVAWWALLTGAVAGLRARLTPRVVRGLNIVSAVVIGGFGLVAIWLGATG